MSSGVEPGPTPPIRSLEEACRVVSSPDRTTWEVPSGFAQGRAVFGGLVLAAALRAIPPLMRAPAPGSIGGTELPLRSVSASFHSAVAPGPCSFEVQAFLASRNLGSAIVHLDQGGARRVSVLASFLGERERPIERTVGPPRGFVPPGSVEAMPFDRLFAPVFTQHFEFRPVGPPPFSGAEAAEAKGWIRAREPGPIPPAAYLVALADTFWPALLPSLDAPRGMVTVAFSLDLVGPPPPLDRGVFHHGRVLAASAGFVHELRELYAEDGRLVAINRQTFALLG